MRLHVYQFKLIDLIDRIISNFGQQTCEWQLIDVDHSSTGKIRFDPFH